MVLTIKQIGLRILPLVLLIGNSCITSDDPEQTTKSQNLNSEDSLKAMIENILKEADSLKQIIEQKDSSILQACYEGTQNMANLNFRKDGSFDIYWSSPFGTNLYHGTYTRKDTMFYLEYHSDQPRTVGTEIWFDGKTFWTTDTNIANGTEFWLVDCKGNN